MADPFSSAMDVLFGSARAEDAEHVSVYGVKTTDVRVIRARADRMVRLGESQIISASQVVQVRTRDLAQVEHDDQLFVGRKVDGVFTPEQELRLTGDAMADGQNLRWTIGAEVVDPSR